MQRIPTKVHGYVDYATGAFLLAAPRILGLRDRRSAAAMRLAGSGALAYSLLTDYELGARRVLPMKAHLALDAGSGVALLASPWLARYAFRGPSEWLGPVLAGVGEIAAAALTETTPGDGGAPSKPIASTTAAPAEERIPVPPVPATDPVDSAEEGIGMPAASPSVAGGAAGVAADDPISDVPVVDPIASTVGQDVDPADVEIAGGLTLPESGDDATASDDGDSMVDPVASTVGQDVDPAEVEILGGIAAPGSDDAAADVVVPGGDELAEAAAASDDTPEVDPAADLTGDPAAGSDDLADPDGDALPGVVSADPDDVLAAGGAGPAETIEEDLERAGPSGRPPQGGRVVSAPPPIDMPGPSVTPPDFPESETERAERADFLAMDEELLAERAEDPVDALIAEEEAAAALEAAGIGGPADLDAGGDPAMEAVYQAGGGEAEGFELAEADLIENATHGEGHGDPLRDALTPEAESDRSTVEYGEPDEEDVTEVVEDPDADPDTDPGAGPGLAADR